jgi:hypothetical protein
MTGPTAPGTDYTVRRAEPSGDAYGPEHQAELAQIVEEPVRTESERQARIADLTRRANEPLMRLIREDAAAAAAHADLRKEILAFPDELPNRRARTLSDPTSLLPSLHGGTNVFSKPYDFEVREPNSPSAQIKTNRVEGTFEFYLPWGEGGGRFANAGIGLTLQAGVTGVAHVRPAWHYELGYWALGGVLSSHTQGAGLAIVQDANTGAVLAKRTAWLWNVDDGGPQVTDDGYIDSWALGLDALVHAGQLFNVTLIATGYVDDSSPTIFASSFARGFLTMSVPFVVVEV